MSKLGTMVNCCKLDAKYQVASHSDPLLVRNTLQLTSLESNVNDVIKHSLTKEVSVGDFTSKLVGHWNSIDRLTKDSKEETEEASVEVRNRTIAARGCKYIYLIGF